MSMWHESVASVANQLGRVFWQEKTSRSHLTKLPADIVWLEARGSILFDEISEQVFRCCVVVAHWKFCLPAWDSFVHFILHLLFHGKWAFDERNDRALLCWLIPFWGLFRIHFVISLMIVLLASGISTWLFRSIQYWWRDTIPYWNLMACSCLFDTMRHSDVWAHEKCING